MREETFINYRGFIWFWAMLFLLLVFAIWYIFDIPIGGRSGASTFGYVSGIFAALAILYLMWFGIRKRSYYAYRVSLKGWLAAHIWLGLALLIIVPLHAAFDFGLNVHSLAYLFLCLVVFSGIIGTFFYKFLPAETISNRGGGTIRKRFEEFASINEEIVKLKTAKGQQFIDLIVKLDVFSEPTLASALFGRKIAEIDQKVAVEKLSKIPDDERVAATKAIALISKKQSLASSLRHEIIVRAKLKAWLFAHIPLSLGLVVLVAIHILSILYFR